MPYIKQEDRTKYNEEIQQLVSKLQVLLSHDKSVLSGHLNYIITTILNQTYQVHTNKINYSLCNDIIGMLDCCKMEFYRRTVVPYENIKILENGDV